MEAKESERKEARSVPWLRRIGMFPIRVYQVTLAWALGGHCRFEPSCSIYALEAIEKHGVVKGWCLAMLRLARCQPFCKGGYDPVPPCCGKGSKEGDEIR